MFPPRFDYRAPRSLEEALAVLAELGSGARPLAGGQSLIPLLKLRAARPSCLVDLRYLGLDGLGEEDGYLVVGATATHAAVEASPLVAERYPLLHDAARVIADPLVRNLGTVGGSAAHADPAGDWGPVLLAARAVMVAAGPSGEREIPAGEFFTGSFETALAPEELLVRILVPRRPRSGGAYHKLHRRVGDFATVGVAVDLTLDGSGAIEDCGIGLAGVGLSYVRAAKAEEHLRGRRPDRAALRRAAEIAAEEVHPVSDHRGSARYKRELVRVFALRGLERALERAGA
ncbi:MAG TPA: xanthine dehydrogenase family protein subunit M [Actinomycetota bacterium]|nr:xanthine dehydrogenase family protein subunit M [Actinomycetota bacterium]